MCTTDTLFCVAETMQHCKSTIIKIKKLAKQKINEF